MIEILIKLFKKQKKSQHFLKKQEGNSIINRKACSYPCFDKTAPLQLFGLFR